MKKLVAMFILMFATTVWAGDFKDGADAYSKRDFTTAVSLYNGQLNILFRMHNTIQYLCATHGEGVLEDFIRAHK
jgi:hypothetical protein